MAVTGNMTMRFSPFDKDMPFHPGQLYSCDMPIWANAVIETKPRWFRDPLYYVHIIECGSHTDYSKYHGYFTSTILGVTGTHGPYETYEEAEEVRDGFLHRDEES